jgi:hypothetical protein
MNIELVRPTEEMLGRLGAAAREGRGSSPQGDTLAVNPVSACFKPPTLVMLARGADNAMRRRYAPRAGIIMRSGCEDIRPGDRLE